MKLIIEGVYNTHTHKKNITKLEEIAKEHIKIILDKITKKDQHKTVEQITSSYYTTDWTHMRRGEDIRFSIFVYKYGRGGATARDIYKISNDTCLRPCYFSTK